MAPCLYSHYFPAPQKRSLKLPITGHLKNCSENLATLYLLITHCTKIIFCASSFPYYVSIKVISLFNYYRKPPVYIYLIDGPSEEKMLFQTPDRRKEQDKDDQEGVEEGIQHRKQQ